MYVTLKFDDNGRCRIHSVSDGDKEIATNKRYVVMPWKMVNVDGKRVSLKEAVDEIFSDQDELANSTYMTRKLDDKGRCKIHSAKRGGASVSDGGREIVTTERYVVMPWKVVNRRGKNGKKVTLEEAVHEIINYKESVDKERERREIEHAEIEAKRKEYYEAHIKSEMERLNNWVDWYEVKLNEIREAPVDSRPRKLRKLYRISERNKHCEVTITSAGVINPVSYPVYPPELKFPECEDNNNEGSLLYVEPNHGIACGKPYDRLDCFIKAVRAYLGRDEDADEYVKKVKAIIDEEDGDYDNLKLEQVRLAMAKVKCPRKLDISVFYQLTGRLPHEDLNYDDERFHFYDTFCNESMGLLGKMVRCRTNVLCHFLKKIKKEPNTDHIQFMKGASHQRTEEEINFVFDHLGWDYSLIELY